MLKIWSAGGEGIVQAGRDLGDVVGRIPLIGEGASNIVRNAFAGGGQPLSDAGTSLEQFILVVAAVLDPGSDRKYDLALAGGERAVVRQELGGGEAEWHRGDTVTLWWPVDSGVLVAEQKA